MKFVNKLESQEKSTLIVSEKSTQILFKFYSQGFLLYRTERTGGKKRLMLTLFMI